MNKERDSTESAAGLLHGIRILDLADEKAAFCSKALAGLGAQVIKVEKPGGDSSRSAEASFRYHNANKMGITLDIEKEEGKRLFLKLVEKADAVIETFPAGYLAAFGCSYEVMSEVNRGLILVSVTGFGQTGPKSDYKSCDLVTSAFGGQMFVSGDSAGAPLRPYGEQSSYVASLFAAIGLLLALIKRRKTGKGEHIDISSQEAVAGTLDHVLVRYLYDGIIPQRQGNLAWNRSSFILSCKDGHIHVSIAGQWETLVEWMAADGMAEDLHEEKWKDEGYRNQNVDHLRDVLQKWTLTHNVGDLFETAQAMRFPWAPVARPEDVIASPQLLAREFFCAVDRPDRFPSCPARREPSPGEDNKTIYCGELGLSEEDLARLLRLGII